MATVAGPEDHDSFDVSDVDSNPLGMYYMKLYLYRNVRTWDAVDKTALTHHKHWLCSLDIRISPSPCSLDTSQMMKHTIDIAQLFPSLLSSFVTRSFS